MAKQWMEMDIEPTGLEQPALRKLLGSKQIIVDTAATELRRRAAIELAEMAIKSGVVSTPEGFRQLMVDLRHISSAPEIKSLILLRANKMKKNVKLPEFERFKSSVPKSGLLRILGRAPKKSSGGIEPHSLSISNRPSPRRR